MALRTHGLARSLPRRLLDELADLVFPPICALCASTDPGDGLGCARHRLRLESSGPHCGRCARALAPMLPDGEPCSECRAKPPSFRRVVALSDYRAGDCDHPVREWLLALKHGGRRDLAPTLGRALGAKLAQCLSEVDGVGRDPSRELHRPRELHRARALVPVPLHPLRRLDRGYDQALLLARAASTVDSIAGDSIDVVRALARVRATAVQGALGSPSRTANVRGAFRARARTVASIAAREVWLVDDVMTSGATADECARVLKRAGAASVSVLVVARAG